MKEVRLTVLIMISAIGLGACSSDPLCEDAQDYQASTLGKRIVSPDGLDTLQEYKELKIPEAAPQTGEKKLGCTDKPPGFFTQ